MHEPRNILANDTLRTRLGEQYGFAVTELALLPLGHDASGWVYRARTDDGATYFLKTRLGGVSGVGLAVPRYPHERETARVVAPLPTIAGALSAPTGDYALILYPFVAGLPAPGEGCCRGGGEG